MAIDKLFDMNDICKISFANCQENLPMDLAHKKHPPRIMHVFKQFPDCWFTKKSLLLILNSTDVYRITIDLDLMINRGIVETKWDNNVVFKRNIYKIRESYLKSIENSELKNIDNIKVQVPDIIKPAVDPVKNKVIKKKGWLI